jgi:hypothetical protein
VTELELRPRKVVYKPNKTKLRQVVINAVSATTSGVMNTNFLENITFELLCSGHTSGSGTLTLLGSNDGVNYTAIAFVDPTQANTNVQNLTRITSLVANSNGAKVGVLENLFKFEFLEFTLTFATDGVYTVYVHADRKAGS